MNMTREERKTTRRAINLIKCEVWCPLHKKNVDVLATCIEAPDHRGCRFYDHLDHMGGIHCAWTEDEEE